LTRAAINGRHDVANFTGIRKSSDNSTEAKLSIWPVDVVGEDDIDLDSEYHIAHLLPAGQRIHEEWFGVAAAVVGLDRNASIRQQLMATVGARAKDEVEVQDPKRGPKRNAEGNTKGKAKTTGQESDSSDTSVAMAPASVEGSATSATKRKPRIVHTGVVHFVSNKLRMMGQGSVLDGASPTMLIIPCMTLKEAKEWIGGGYKAVVLTGLPKTQSPPTGPYAKLNRGDRAKQARQAFVRAGMATEDFQTRYSDTTEIDGPEQVRELERARTFLKDCMLGLSRYVANMAGADLASLQPANQTALFERGRNLGDQAPIPTTIDTTPPTKPLLFIDFGSHNNDRKMHPAPDPLLLCAKACSAWGVMNGYKILASGEPAEDEQDSLDELAEQTYLEMQDVAPPIPEHIMVVVPQLQGGIHA
jgi:hypothetical protein